MTGYNKVDFTRCILFLKLALTYTSLLFLGFLTVTATVSASHSQSLFHSHWNTQKNHGKLHVVIQRWCVISLVSNKGL